MSDSVRGKVIAIAEDGSLITDIMADALRDLPHDESVVVACDEHETRGIFPADHGQPASTFLAVLNREGQLTLTIVGIPAAEMLGIRLGEEVAVRVDN